MYCYNEEGELLGVVSCFPQIGEEHMWDDVVYVCVGITDNKGCKNGMTFKRVSV